MTAMGVLGVADKVNMADEKEERLRAAVMKGAPPPPMGYAGGAPLPGRNTVLTRKNVIIVVFSFLKETVSVMQCQIHNGTLKPLYDQRYQCELPFFEEKMTYNLKINQIFIFV